VNRTAHLRIAAIQQGPNEADPRRNVDALLRSTFFGKSCIIAPGGTVLAQAPGDVPCILRAALDLGEVGRTRARLPLLRDRRPAAYSRLRYEGASR